MSSVALVLSLVTAGAASAQAPFALPVRLGMHRNRRDRRRDHAQIREGPIGGGHRTGEQPCPDGDLVPTFHLCMAVDAAGDVLTSTHIAARRSPLIARHSGAAF